jgi:hypothetical protein
VVNQKLISAAIWIIGLIFIPWAVANSLEGDAMFVMALGGLSFLLFVFFILKDKSCALPLFGVFFVGKLNFLPIGLTAMSVLTLGLIVYYFFGYFTLKQGKISVGPFFLFLPILVIAAIVLYHSRKAGFHALGSNMQGSLPGFLMLLGAIGYICGVSISTPPASFFARLPWYCTIVGILTNMPSLLSTYIPSLAPYLYYVTDAVNVEAYLETQGYDTGIERAGGFAGMGSYLEIYLLAHYPVHTWWRPQRWWVPIVLIFCLGTIVSGGFRSAVAIFGFIFVLAAWAYYSWRSVLFLPIALLCVFGLSVCAQSGLVDLPLSIQRSLSFLPGNWDAEAVESASASSDFRENVKQVYMREEFYKSPLLGNGFTFDAAEQEMLTKMSFQGDTEDHYYATKAFIVAKNYHVGWISLYDMVGLIGGAAFVALGLGMIGMAIRFIRSQTDHFSPLFPLKVWLFCGIAREFVGYFTVFGDIRTTFPYACAYAIILIQLDRLERGWSMKPALPVFQKQDDIRKSGRIAPPEPSFLPPV